MRRPHRENCGICHALVCEHTRAAKDRVIAAAAQRHGAEVDRLSLAQEVRVPLEAIAKAMDALKFAGWITHGSPPKDRDSLMVTAGSTGVFRGRWMTASYFVEDGGDLWPATPIAWRNIP